MNQPVKKRAPLSADALSVLCYQLSLMAQAGIGSEEGLALLADDARDEPGGALLAQLHQSLEAGLPLSQALEDSGAFPAYLVRMVEIGQASGRLDQVFTALAAYYAREADTRESLRRAVAYPAVMAVLIAVVFLVLVSRVLPVFQQVFTQLGVSLSPTARGLLQFGSISKYVAGVLAVVLVAGAVALLCLFRAQKGGAVFGALFAKTASARAVDRSRFASAMALMLSSGLPLDEAMARSRQLLEQSALAPALAQCQADMEGGASFPKAAEANGIFSGLQSGLLSAGFRSGVSDQAMEELSRRCQAQADTLLGRMLGRFEYALVAVLCLSVGLVLLSVMLPLLGVLSAIG